MDDRDFQASSPARMLAFVVALLLVASFWQEPGADDGAVVASRDSAAAIAPR
jgi:hypothetical protein